jgi:ribosomal-protein-alanine N-acetyltransferase
VILRTARLLLRPWREEDRAPFAALNADPAVMEHFPSVLGRDESDAMVARIQAHFGAHGWGLFAVEVPGESPFIGFIGLNIPRWTPPFSTAGPCVEAGWRLARAAWGRGYAVEGARAAIAFGFETLGLEEIVALTVPANLRSRRVMERLGMVHDVDGDFDHPLMPDGSPLRRHVLYRLRREAFQQQPPPR